MARQRAAAAISSVSPRRCGGVVDHAPRTSAGRAWSRRRGWGPGAMPLTRTWGEVLGQQAGELGEAVGGAVGAEVALGQRAPEVMLMMLPPGLAHRGHAQWVSAGAAHVEAQDLVEALGRQLERIVRAGAAGVIDQVGEAPEPERVALTAAASCAGSFTSQATARPGAPGRGFPGHGPRRPGCGRRRPRRRRPRRRPGRWPGRCRGRRRVTRATWLLR